MEEMDWCKRNGRMKGLFVTFEGPDGAGKTTQVHKAAGFLHRYGMALEVTREPGGTALGEQIRKWLLSETHAGMSAETEVLLYAASRAQHVAERIQPALDEGKVVLCDRYVDASLAYQGYGNGLPIDWVKLVNMRAIRGLMPVRTYLLDVPVEVGLERLMVRSKGRLDRIEGRSEAYHRRVREGFHQLLKTSPGRFFYLDATLPVEEVAGRIREDLSQLLGLSSEG